MITRRNFFRKASAASALTMIGSIQSGFAQQLEQVVNLSAKDQNYASHYMLGKNVTYLNHGSMGTTPRVVHQAHVDYLKLCESNPSFYVWGDDWKVKLEEVRSKIASFIKVTPGELAITRNTTEGINLLAAGLPLGLGDEVLFSDLNHAAASVCWHHYGASRGYSVRSFEIDIDQQWKSEEQIANLYLNQLTANTKVLVLPHMDNLIGLRHPIKLIAKEAREFGVEYIVVDGAQTVGMFPLDVAGLGVDFYASSTHKWLGSPKGVGMIYINKRRQKELSPLIVGNEHRPKLGSIQQFEEYSTRNLPEVLSLGDAVDFASKLGIENTTKIRRAWRRSFIDQIKQQERVKFVSPEKWELNGSLFSITIGNKNSTQLGEKLLSEHGITVRAFNFQGNKLVRISPNVNNGPEDIKTLVRAIS